MSWRTSKLLHFAHHLLEVVFLRDRQVPHVARDPPAAPFSTVAEEVDRSLEEVI